MMSYRSVFKPVRSGDQKRLDIVGGHQNVSQGRVGPGDLSRVGSSGTSARRAEEYSIVGLGRGCALHGRDFERHAVRGLSESGHDEQTMAKNGAFRIGCIDERLLK